MGTPYGPMKVNKKSKDVSGNFCLLSLHAFQSHAVFCQNGLGGAMLGQRRNPGWHALDRGNPKVGGYGGPLRLERPGGGVG